MDSRRIGRSHAPLQQFSGAVAQTLGGGQQPGGGLVAANTLYNTAAKDGTAIALLQSTSFLMSALADPDARFDNTQFAQIGNMNEEADTCSVSPASGIATTQDYPYVGQNDWCR